jgi:hypothetical protein
MKNILAIFTPKPEPEAPRPEPKGGLDVLRARARGHVHLPQDPARREEARPQAHAWLKEALGVSGNALDTFLAGGPLPLPKIVLLIDYLGMKAEYLPDVDLLRSTAPEPTPAYGVVPAPYEAKPFVPATQPIGLGCYPPSLYPRPPGVVDRPAWPSEPGWA